jgi:hypothetical protein
MRTVTLKIASIEAGKYGDRRMNSGANSGDCIKRTQLISDRTSKLMLVNRETKKMKKIFINGMSAEHGSPID